jgi:hypothetical protein
VPASDQLEIYPEPQPFKTPRKLKIIVAVMVVSALGGLAGVAAASQKKKAPSTGPQYEGFAVLVAQNYVAGRSLDVPVASGVTTSLGRLSQAATQTNQGSVSGSQPSSTVKPLKVAQVSFESSTDTTTKATGTVETDTFWLEYENGSIGQLAVVVNGGPHGPALGALPTLMPGPPAGSATPVQTGLPLDQQASPLPHNIIYQVGQWATAFVSNDKQALYQVTGDTSSQTFTGIGGYTLVGNPTIVSSSPYNAKHPPKTLTVTVQLTMVSKTDPTVLTRSSYDVVVTSLSNAYPNVVAWGPPGSGSTLVAYQNAS